MNGTLIVSLDFELFWGMMDHTTLEEYRANVLGGRQAIPELLELFQRHGIHATWAAVGFLFAGNRRELEPFLPNAQDRPAYENSALDPYARLDEVEKAEADCFFAPGLLETISRFPGQEIGSHTFSHYYCREAGQTRDQFRADMTAAKKIARAKGYDLRSVILPRNQCTPECVSVLRELGFSCYRDEENDWIHEKVKLRPLLRLLRLADVYLPLTGQGGYKPQDEDGIVNLVGSRMYKPIFSPLKFLESWKLRRIKAQMRHAAKHGLTFHLWWHPHNVGVHTREHLAQLEEIFSYYDELKETYGMASLNMGEAAEASKA